MQSCQIVFAVIAVLSGVLQAEEATQHTSRSQSEIPHASPAKPKSLPRFSQLEDEVHQLLRQHAATESAGAKLAETVQLVHVARKLTADPRFATSPTLQSMRARLFARLRTVKKDTVKQLRRHKKKQSTITIPATVLLQLNQVANPNANQPNGPAAVGNGVGLPDYGPQLIDLIQRTISPNSWDVNGGASTISYWRPGMALVVRAPQSLHREVSPLLRQLRQQ